MDDSAALALGAGITLLLIGGVVWGTLYLAKVYCIKKFGEKDK